MAPTADFRALWQTEAYEAFSDVTIKFSGQFVKCHKIVLCSRSGYFAGLCGPGSRFAESDAKTIELHDDDPNAVYAILRHLYGFESEVNKYNEQDDQKRRDFLLHLILAADKYLVHKLKDQAINATWIFVRRINNTTDAANFLEAIDDLTRDPKIEAMQTEITQKFMPALLKEPWFRAKVDQDKALMWRCLDDYVSFHVEKMKLTKGTVSVNRLPNAHYGRIDPSEVSIKFTQEGTSKTWDLADASEVWTKLNKGS